MIKEAIEKVIEASGRDHGLNTSDGIRALANGLFTLFRCFDAEGMTEKQLIDNAALLSGMACAALMDYAKRLEEEGQ